MQTRYATSEDIPAIVRLINSAYRVEDFFIDGDRTSASDIEARMTAPDSCFIVADGPNPEDLAGAVWVEFHENRGHFGMLSVDPASQGTGLGRTLVNAVEDHCRTAGCDALDIEVVNLRLELPPFYAKLGFTSTETAPFPDTGKLRREAHLILMSKPLTAP